MRREFAEVANGRKLDPQFPLKSMRALHPLEDGRIDPGDATTQRRTHSDLARNLRRDGGLATRRILALVAVPIRAVFTEVEGEGGCMLNFIKSLETFCLMYIASLTSTK